ncbi:Uncharacterised protein [Nocardia africana]|uniref:Uncharacterized protein n=1 Tax=Nocardia africana TaxID=134964 RepID=A0A378WHG8_9NOCA|nr:Uncharacterised protein [Nocardia africana]
MDILALAQAGAGIVANLAFAANQVANLVGIVVSLIPV